MEQLHEYRARLLESLGQQPQQLADALAGVPEADWHRRRTPDGLTLHHLVSHLRDLEVLAHLPRLRRILAEDEPRLEAFPSHNWTDDDYDPTRPMTDILAEYALAREEALLLLRNLAPGDWSRLSFHPPSGRRTLQWWVERMWAHTYEHLAEIAAARRAEGGGG